MKQHDIFLFYLLQQQTHMKDEMEWKEARIFKIESHAATKSSRPSVVQETVKYLLP